MGQPPAGTLQCFPSSNPDDNIMSLFRSDGVHWIYVKDIPASQCPIVRSPIIQHTVKIAASYLSSHAIPASEVSNFITNLHLAVTAAAARSELTVTPETFKPAHPIKKSITPDAIFSLEDGKPYKTLKRHLALRGLTPESYRAKWNLPADYPMVAPEYSKKRSTLATSLGLGHKPAAEAAPARKPRRPQRT